MARNTVWRCESYLVRVRGGTPRGEELAQQCSSRFEARFGSLFGRGELFEPEFRRRLKMLQKLLGDYYKYVERQYGTALPGDAISIHLYVGRDATGMLIAIVWRDKFTFPL